MNDQKNSTNINKMVHITFQNLTSPTEKWIGTVPSGSTILQAAIAAQVQLQSACGGKGNCGKCRVVLGPEDRTEPLPQEIKHLSAEQIENGVVLACQRHAESDMVVQLIQQNDVFNRKTQLEKVTNFGKLRPLILKHFLKIDRPSIIDQRSDWERLQAAIPELESLRFNRKIAASLPNILRSAAFEITAVTARDELLAVEPGDTRSRSFGLAIDIGTTTVVVYLMDLNNGNIVGQGALTNPQQGAGADVLSRILYVKEQSDGLSMLQAQVIQGLNQVIANICSNEGIKAEEIYQAVVVGNTTMSHLFLGIDPTYLGPAPFIPAFRRTVTVKASELGLNILEHAPITVLPIVAGYVGSDTVGVMLAGQVDRLEGIHLLVDIGTNGEMVMVGKGRILTCSTAAGPAFEGAKVKHGMRAADGAIERVKITEDVTIGVIGKEKEKVKGICGSGLIDAVSEMVKAGIITAEGKFVNTESDLARFPQRLRDRIVTVDGMHEFILAKDTESEAGENISITQIDIRGLQLGKGAILTGIRVLMSHLGVEPKDIAMIHLAGAFGNYIAKESALGISLLPQVPLDRIKSIGNAAGIGAQMALLSTDAMERAERLALQAEHIELSTEPLFNEEFLRSFSLQQED